MYCPQIKSQADLDDVMSDPDVMRIQALIIRERILGPAHPDTSFFIRYRGALYADAGNIPKCINLWLYALRMQQEILKPLSLMTQSSLVSFAELFSYILSKRISGAYSLLCSGSYTFLIFAHVLSLFVKREWVSLNCIVT